MRLKLDENLPAALVEKLSGLGHDVDTVLAEDLRGHPDRDIWEAAQREQRFLVTQDLDLTFAVQARTHHRYSSGWPGPVEARC
jgi:predicted nuclease of predicted toxin-antitoxin system